MSGFITSKAAKISLGAVFTFSVLIYSGYGQKMNFKLIQEFKTYIVDDDNTAGPWLGTEENPFNKISQGLNVARDGDTVFVKSGTYSEGSNPAHRIYYSINLIGENKYNTVIDEYPNSADVISIHTGNVKIRRFTIRGSNSHAGIGIRRVFSPEDCDNNIIEDNLILDNHCGIDIWGSNNNKIRNNIIKNPIDGGSYGIILKESSNNRVYGNEIDLSYQMHSGGFSLLIVSFCGLSLFNPPSNNNFIFGNIFDNNQTNTSSTHIQVQTCPEANGHTCNCYGTQIIVRRRIEKA